jgi:hypothetical protein
MEDRWQQRHGVRMSVIRDKEGKAYGKVRERCEKTFLSTMRVRMKKTTRSQVGRQDPSGGYLGKLQ